MREVYIVEQEQDGVQCVVLLWLALLPSAEEEKQVKGEAQHHCRKEL